jgi:hypothetical protein
MERTFSKTALNIYSGREAAKMGVAKNGLCLLVGPPDPFYHFTR